MVSKSGEIMTAGAKKSVGVGERGAAIAADVEAVAALKYRNPLARNNLAQQVALLPAGRQFSPDAWLAWVIGLLALGACLAPWFQHGWAWFEVVAAAVALLVGYDALAL